jgi:uncharacterized protein (DUF2141 family)
MTRHSPDPQTQGRRKSILRPLERGAQGMVVALTLLAVAAPPALAADVAMKGDAAGGLASLTVRFHGLKSRAGMVMMTLSGGADAYDGKAPATAQAGVAIAGDGVAITFEGLKPGRYAVKAFHDLNGDGKLNANPFGIPTEPYAFSNNAQGLMGPPGWAAAAFEVKAGANRQTIDID